MRDAGIVRAFTRSAELSRGRKWHVLNTLGLAGIIQRLSLDRIEHPVEVVYPASGQVYFERLRHASSFYEVATLLPRPIHVAPGEEVEVCRAGKARILTRALEHGIDCQGYRLQEEHGNPTNSSLTLHSRSPTASETASVRVCSCAGRHFT